MKAMRRRPPNHFPPRRADSAKFRESAVPVSRSFWSAHSLPAVCEGSRVALTHDSLYMDVHVLAAVARGLFVAERGPSPLSWTVQHG
jgi:hypothetical protein